MAVKKKGAGKRVVVDGIAVDVAVDPANDWGLAEASLTLNDPDATQLEKSRAMVKQCRIILGGSYDSVMEELRERNGGALPIAEVVSFCNRCVKAEGGDAKN